MCNGTRDLRFPPAPRRVVNPLGQVTTKTPWLLDFSRDKASTTGMYTHGLPGRLVDSLPPFVGQSLRPLGHTTTLRLLRRTDLLSLGLDTSLVR